MNLNSKIYIAGHNGMVGSAIWRTLERKGYTNFIGVSSKVLEKLFVIYSLEKPISLLVRK